MSNEIRTHSEDIETLAESGLAPIDITRLTATPLPQVNKWFNGESKSRYSNGRKLGDLVCAVRFLEEELSFEGEDTYNFFFNSHLNTDTMTTWRRADLWRNGNTSEVLQQAIELCIGEASN